ncbi:MAG: S-layer homology domain-containing protein [Clostridia bacterium]|nr:S-layer homology domain-containing protein [Clostridia bacterium]
MKKVFILIVAAVLLASLAAVVNASFGVVVEAYKTEEQPNLQFIDSSWGEPVATNITSASENTYLWKFYSFMQNEIMVFGGNSGPNGRASLPVEDEPMDLYLRWDDTYLYFGLVATDYDLRGHGLGHHGDGVQLWIEPAKYVQDPTVGGTVNYNHASYNPYWYCWTLGFDDWSTSIGNYDPEHMGATNAAQALDPRPIVNVDPNDVGEDCFHAIAAIPWDFLLNSKREIKEFLVDGSEVAIAFLRVSATSATCTDHNGITVDDDGYAGGLCWGKYWKKSEPNTGTGHYAEPTNTSLNTIILRDSETAKASEQEDTTSPETEDTTAETAPNLEGVSAWALTEVEAGIKEGLVPENLQANYTSPVTRGAVAQMFVNLLEKAAGKSIDDIMAEKGVAINEGAFTDTTDKAVLAANALGIINGTGSGKFSPDGTLKRAQIAAIINRVARVMGIETDGFTHEFNDITDNYKWADTELGWPVHAGVINGVGGGRFNPGGDLTTEQAILITYRALGALK